MVDDKYIGLGLAVLGSLAIGTSFIITKKGLNNVAERDSRIVAASDGLTYLRNPIWWAGISTLVLGEIANFAAYTFAPPILVTPLGALSVLIGAIEASILLKEELGHIGRIGCTLCLLGSFIIVLHAPEDEEIQTVDEILHYAVQPGFLLYCFTVLVITLVMIYSVAPTQGKNNPLVYLSICSLVGSISVMCIKGFGIALKLTVAGKNQLTHPSTYVFAIITAVCIVVQMHYFNKALDTFSTNVVNPIYYVGFSTATIVASLILFQGFNTTDGTNTASLIAGFLVTFLGVHLLNLSRKPDVPPAGHLPMENGLMNPRMSMSGRLSLDGWNPVDYRPDGLSVPLSAGHGRRSSLYRAQTSALHNAFNDEEEAVALTALHNVEEEEEGGHAEDANERTRLRSDRWSRREHEVDGGRHPAALQVDDDRIS